MDSPPLIRSSNLNQPIIIQVIVNQRNRLRGRPAGIAGDEGEAEN